MFELHVFGADNCHTSTSRHSQWRSNRTGHVSATDAKLRLRGGADAGREEHEASDDTDQEVNFDFLTMRRTIRAWDMLTVIDKEYILPISG